MDVKKILVLRRVLKLNVDPVNELDLMDLHVEEYAFEMC